MIGRVWLARQDQWNNNVDWCYCADRFRDLVATAQLIVVCNVLEGAIKVGSIVCACIVEYVVFVFFL